VAPYARPVDDAGTWGGEVGQPRPLPLFPLGLPLLPGGRLALHIFEPRYRRFMAWLLALPEQQREFGVVALRGGQEVGDDVADELSAVHRVGTVARIEDTTAYEDGRFDLARVAPGPGEPAGAESGPRWALGTVTLLDEPVGDDAGELAVATARLLARYCALLPRAVAVGLDLPEPGRRFDVVATSYALARAAVLPLPERQALLESPSAAARLRLTHRLLVRETAVIAAVPSLPVSRADLPEPVPRN